jgi:hypothetical protein
MPEQKKAPAGRPGRGDGVDNQTNPSSQNTPEMSSQKGWIALYRQLIDSRVFQNEGLLKVWIWCLLKARHKPGWATMKVGRSETEVWLEKGQFVYGRKSAAKQLRMKPDSVRTRMEKLKNMQNITIDSTTHYSIITVVNWDTYQQQEKNNTIDDTSRTPAGHQPDTTNNNGNHVLNHGDNGQQQAGCSCGEPLSFKEEAKSQPASQDGEQPPVDSIEDEARRHGIAAETMEHINLKTEQARLAGKIRSTPAAYRHGLIKKAQDGMYDVSGLDELRQQMRPQGARQKGGTNRPMPGDLIEWALASKDPWEILDMDREDFRQGLADGRVLFDSKTKSYAVREYLEEYDAGFFKVASPETEIQGGSSTFEADGRVYDASIPNGEADFNLMGNANYDNLSPKMKHNARVLADFVKGGDSEDGGLI